VIKQFPAEAAKANLSVQDVKDAVAELKAPAMARGGRTKRMARGGEAMMADGGMLMGRGVSMPEPKPAPLNPGHKQMMGSYSVEPGTPFYNMMSGQRAMARGRGGF
jgi:hypothetical protein